MHWLGVVGIKDKGGNSKTSCELCRVFLVLTINRSSLAHRVISKEITLWSSQDWLCWVGDASLSQARSLELQCEDTGGRHSNAGRGSRLDLLTIHQIRGSLPTPKIQHIFAYTALWLKFLQVCAWPPSILSNQFGLKTTGRSSDSNFIFLIPGVRIQLKQHKFYIM